ncbi:O-antigen ligase family protein [Patescibacteria group bacterium]|nr:O-antigen ligase family protein [Patescibacteria group bacterium]
MSQVNNNLLEKILKLIIIGGSLLVVLAPLIVIPHSYFPYIIQKTLILRILIEAVFGAYLILALFKPEYRPKKSVLIWAVSAFFAVMLLTTFTGQGFARSWWGNWERMFGTFNYLHYFVWFIVLASVFNNKKVWNIILNATLFVSLLIGLYSLSQRLGLSFTFQSGLERVNGTVGNAAYLASYMLFHLFVALLFIVEKAGLKWKLYYLSIFILDFIVLILTGTRGALLALFFSLPAFIIIALWLKVWKQKAIKILVVGSVILLILVGILYSLRSTNFVEGNYWLRRLTSYSLNDSTVQTRLHAWNWGLKGFRDNLLLGVGPENYQIVFSQYFEGDFYDYSGNEVWFDRAHNTLVDMAATMGIFGLLLYLAIFGIIFYYLYDLHGRNRMSSATFIVLFLLFFSYFFQNIFVFDSLNSLIPFYLLLAFIAFIYSNNQESAEVLPGKRVFQNLKISPYLSIPLVVVGFSILFFTVNLPEVKANIYVYDAFINGKLNKYTESVDGYRLVYNITVNKIDPAILLSTSLNEMIGMNMEIAPQEKEIEDLQTAIEWMDKAIELDPNNMFLYYIQSRNYSLLLELSPQIEYLNQGIKFAKKANELSPGRLRPVWTLAQLYLFGNQPEKALEYLNQAVEINDRLSQTYYYLAVVYKNMGNLDKVHEQYDKLIDSGYQFMAVSQMQDIIAYCEEKQDVKKLIYLFEQLTSIEPQNFNYWNDLIDLLAADGQYDQALATLQKWAEIMPAASSHAYTRYQEILKQKDEAIN